MQATVQTENLFVKTKTHQPVLQKRTIIEAVIKNAPQIVKNQIDATQKVKYPTNGLYGLL